MTTSADVREHLIEALHLDLIGPRPDDKEREEEILLQTPSKLYLTGFLVPSTLPLSLKNDDFYGEVFDEIGEIQNGDDDSEPEEEAQHRHNFLPSSIGLSVLVELDVEELEVILSWGEYREFKWPRESEERGKREANKEEEETRWQRIPHHVSRRVDISIKEDPDIIELKETRGLCLVVSVREVKEGLIEGKKVKAISIFFVNHRPLRLQSQRDHDYIFQAMMRLRSESSFVSRPDIKGQHLDDWDEKVADLQYRTHFEYVVGHNVSATADIDDDGVSCYEVRTSWIPQARIEKVIPAPLEDIEFGMEALADIETPQEMKEKLINLVEQYGDWIEANRQLNVETEKRKEVAMELLRRASRAKKRLAQGIEELQKDDIFQAFKIMNRVMARASRQRFSLEREDKDPLKVSAPTWRPFQLAFILLNLRGIADPRSEDREIVELLFFPTGGGKTEAYLGLSAMTLILRRLRHPGLASAGLSVLMRYTLRLLTFDQMSRASLLICALELERQQNKELLGEWPFEIGLWVGQNATPNKMGKKGDNDNYSARRKTLAFLNDDVINPSPIPLENCPWCGAKFTRESFELHPNADEPKELRIHCSNPQCTYGIKRRNRRRIKKLPLPIVAVDEVIYRRLPCFMIATVDKFANLPWVGQTAGFFGKVERHDKDGFYGASDPRQGYPLPSPLLPPDLVIQDELHLITGPLGTMVGLYETAIDALATRKIDGKTLKPKIIASTATVKRASKQVRALFGRHEVEIFPPPGINQKDSFFAKTVSKRERHPRLYVGIAAQGRNMKFILMRVYLTLLSAAQKAWNKAGGKKNPQNPADPYMTLLGYFSSLRELGGSRRVIEDEVFARLHNYENRYRLGEQRKDSLFANRKINYSPLELTSRISTNKVAEAKRRLSLSFAEKDHVDIALATNMISVGLDITRLGLMVVFRQPIMTAEYIQATSRVGRDDERPGLVVTMLSMSHPRDRSHYERFETWHNSFYRAVEASSVTPFSPRALDRGLAGVTVALARLGHPQMTAPEAASLITTYRSELAFVPETIAHRAENHDKDLDADEALALRQKVRDRTNDLLDTWDTIARKKQALQYQQEIGRLPPLLHHPLDPELTNLPLESHKFKVQRSLRDVEQTVKLWVRYPDEVPPKNHR